MARNTTRQGADYELDIMHYLAGTKPDVWGPGFGYDCWRSSGSRGAIDVTAVGPTEPYELWDNPHTIDAPGGPLLFIQAKRNKVYLDPADTQRVWKLAYRAGAVPLLSSMTEDVTTGLKRPHFWVIDPIATPSKWAPWEPGEELS